MAMSLNKVQIIGNVTRDPELKQIPGGQTVVSFSVATNFTWKDQAGAKQERVEFHNIVAWGKLAEICAQLLKKGKKVFVEGRLQTRSWQGQDGTQKQRTEIVISDMVILDRKMDDGATEINIPDPAQPVDVEVPETNVEKKTSKKVKAEPKEEPEEEDIPF